MPLWGRQLVVALSFDALTQVAIMAGAFKGVEQGWLDLVSYVDRPAVDAPVTVVAISDACYRDTTLFRSMSPLHPAGLQRIIEQVAAHRPQLVVLDVLIDPRPHEPPDRALGRARLLATLRDIARQQNGRWILIRDPEDEASVDTASIPDSVRGAWSALVQSPSVTWAHPTLGPDGSSPIRELRITDEKTEAEGLGTVLGSVVHCLESLAGSRPPTPEQVEERRHPWRVRYSGVFMQSKEALSPHHIDAQVLLQAPAQGQLSMLHDQVVLIGGTYADTRDFHPTPLGSMAGVFIWAEGVASWLRNDVLREPPRWLATFADIVLGMLCGRLLARFGPGTGTLLSIGVVIPLALVVSAWTYGDRGYFLNFLPAAIGVAIQFQFELHDRIRHLQSELDVQRERERARRRRVRARRNMAPPPRPDL